MRGPKRIAERSIATFLFGCVAFSPPFLAIFGAEAFMFGLPLLYLYLFAVWGLIIVLVAWTADLGSGSPSDNHGERRTGRTRAG